MKPDTSPENTEGQPGLFQAALSGLCPRCGEATLFEAPASIAVQCENCRLDYSEIERGARWTGLMTIAIAAVLISAAIGIDIALKPPFWLQAVFWSAVTITSVLGGLRIYKTALLYAQYEAKLERENSGE